MKSQQVEYQGENYRYVLSVLDVFFLYHWLAPLTLKHATKVAIELKKIYDVHELQRTYRVAEARNFMGSVKTFCERKKIKMTKSPPANSRQSQKIPQNTKKEDKLRSCEAGSKRC